MRNNMKNQYGPPKEKKRTESVKPTFIRTAESSSSGGIDHVVLLKLDIQEATKTEIRGLRKSAQKLATIDGVESVVSGYMGGETKNPTYREICTGRTGHAEVVQVTFDPSVISYKDLLDWFWRLHDPTTLNRQGADVGTQYRSAIFTHSEDQARIAATSKKDVQPTFDDPIVTEVTPAI